MDAAAQSKMAKPLYVDVSECRNCQGRLRPFLDLGSHPLPDFGQPVGGSATWLWAPLEMVRCDSCGLVQSGHTVDRSSLFHRYWYTSGLNESMRQHLSRLAWDAFSYSAWTPDDVVLDIGCNDGTLLDSFLGEDFIRIGFEPSAHHASLARSRGRTGATWHRIVEDFFTAERYWDMTQQRARLVFTIAMFYSVADPQQFIRDITRVMHHDGLWICEMNTIEGLLETRDYGFIGHEHLALWSWPTFDSALQEAGLSTQMVKYNVANGTSTRFYIKGQGTRGGLNPGRLTFPTVEELPALIQEHGQRLHDLVKAEWDQGKRIHILGASTRGVTVLHYSGIAPYITAASDRNERKHGMLFPGTDIPILSEEVSRRLAPDTYLIMPWAMSRGFQQRERDAGFRGSFLVPFPEPRLT